MCNTRVTGAHHKTMNCKHKIAMKKFIKDTEVPDIFSLY